MRKAATVSLVFATTLRGHLSREAISLCLMVSDTTSKGPCRGPQREFEGAGGRGELGRRVLSGLRAVAGAFRARGRAEHLPREQKRL